MESSVPGLRRWTYYLYKDGFTGDCRECSNVFIRLGEKHTFQSIQIELVHSDDSLNYVRVKNLKL